MPPDAGFGEDAFDLRAHGVFSRAHGIRDLPRRMPVTQQQCVVGEKNKDLDERWLKIKNRSYSQAEAGMNCCPFCESHRGFDGRSFWRFDNHPLAGKRIDYQELAVGGGRVQTARLNVGAFTEGQRRLLEYHRNSVLLQRAPWLLGVIALSCAPGGVQVSEVSLKFPRRDRINQSGKCP